MSNQNASASDLATIEEKYDSITAVVIRRLSVAMFVLTVSVLYLSFRMPLAPDAGLWAGAYLGVSVALYLLQRFGRMRLAAICLVASLWLAATVAIGRYSGVGGMLFACYIVITFLAAVVMRSNRWLIVLLVCVLSGGVLYGAEAQGFWTPRGYGPAAPWFPVAFQVSLLLVTSSLIMWGRQQVGTALQALRVKNS